MKQRTASRNHRTKDQPAVPGRLPLYLTQFGFFPVSNVSKAAKEPEYYSEPKPQRAKTSTSHNPRDAYKVGRLSETRRRPGTTTA